MPTVKNTGLFKWDRLDVLKYKEKGNHFKDITRQLLYPGRPELPVQFRYFEIAPGGHSTLERHEHVHMVMVIRGSGEALVGNEIHKLESFDLVEIPPKAWHQFRATANETFGFLCLVRTERDKPELPSGQDLVELKKYSAVAEFIRYEEPLITVGERAFEAVNDRR
jgi:quercetin dioxygenase-like cupin family protein